MFLGFVARAVGQQPIVLDDTSRFYQEETDFAIQIDADRAFSSKDINSPAFLKGFKPVSRRGFNIGLTPAAVWLRFSARETAGRQWLLRAGNPTSQGVTFYTPRSSGACDSMHLSFEEPIRNRPWRDNHYFFDLRFPDGPEQTFFVRITSQNPISDRPVIATPRSFFAREHRRDMWAGIYLGLILVMVLYNLFIFFSTLDRSFLYYVVYVLSVGLLVSMHDAYPFDLFWPDTPALNHFMPLLASLGGIFAILFTATFLHTRSHAPRLHKGLMVILVIYAATAVLLFAGQHRTAALIQQVSGFSAIYVLFVAAYIYRQGYKPARFYLLAWTCLVIGLTTYVIGALGFGDMRALGIDALQLGSAAEALLLSFALADRFNRYREERIELVRHQKTMLEAMVAERTVALEREKKKSEDLLHNILPLQVAAELREHGRVEARDHEQVTVMFTDFKDFTRISEQVPAARLIREVDVLFSAFDTIIRKHGIEKIKTIGDAYMCVGGLPQGSATHAHDVVRAGLEIRDYMVKEKARRLESGEIAFDVRIGIHSGPVVAGIVGLNKFAYDIWGATVNLASRMEGSGLPGQVNISGVTYELIKDHFNCTYRGKVLTKDKAEVDMYFVEPK